MTACVEKRATVRLKTAYGGTVLVAVDDLQAARAQGRKGVRGCDERGQHREDRDGRMVWYAFGYVLEQETERPVVAWRETFPDGSRHRGYWYADDMLGGRPRHMADGPAA